MKQYAGALLVCVCLGAVTAVGAGCGSSSSSGGSGTTAGTGAGGTGAGGTGTGGTTGAGTEVPLPSDMTGFVQVDTLGIKGAWYAYGDGIGPDGTSATGNCESIGMHMVSECSSITTPTFGSFANTGSSMCTAGNVAKVINLTGMTTCPATSASCDYSNIFGAGIGVDLNNGGGDAGVKGPFNATAAGVIGIAFDIDAVPLTGLRIEFPTPSTANTAAIWTPGTAATNFVSPVKAGHNVILFKDVKQASFVTGAAALDPTQVVSVQFHVPTSTSAAAPYNFCISGFSAVTM